VPRIRGAPQGEALRLAFHSPSTHRLLSAVRKASPSAHRLLSAVHKAQGLTAKYHDDDLADSIARPLGYSGRVLLETYHVQFTKQQKFSKDKRGSWDRDWILQEDDLLLEFKHYMMAQSYLTIDSVCKWVNSDQFLGAADRKDLADKYKVTLPVDRDKTVCPPSTVRRPAVPPSTVRRPPSAISAMSAVLAVSDHCVL
jgi:hypothetical protein